MGVDSVTVVPGTSDPSAETSKVADRLRAAGFEAADIDYAASFTDAERKLYALPADHIYAVYKH